MVSIDQIDKQGPGCLIERRTTESPFKEGSTGFFPTGDESSAPSADPVSIQKDYSSLDDPAALKPMPESSIESQKPSSLADSSNQDSLQPDQNVSQTKPAVKVEANHVRRAKGGRQRSKRNRSLSETAHHRSSHRAP